MDYGIVSKNLYKDILYFHVHETLSNYKNKVSP